jgi:phosphatidate cytidylyltransferase
MLLTRILTAIAVAVVLGVILLALPAPLALGALGLMTLAGAWEWSAFAGLASRASRLAYVAGCLVVMTVLWGYAATPEGFRTAMTATLLWWGIAFCWIAMAPSRGHRWLSGLAGILALVPMWVAMARLYQAGMVGRELVILGLGLAWAADVGAYFAGRRFGRIKLAPWVSPNKTWEGAIGGLLAGAIVAVAATFWFSFEPAGFLPLCAAVVVISIVGDLTESMFKRQIGLKDSGRLLPGHGGVLDRIDSLTAAVPLLALGLQWLGVLQ